ncbi:MAG TPA: hypothetical protein VGQ04_21965, partial [Chitinophagaceae bacterium]|nr:hypothetical protein [Chitinophagaceae bacterium]
MRIIVVIIFSSLVFGASAQDRAYIDVKYKKLNLPLVTSLTDTNAFFFFSSDNLLWFSTRQGLTSFDGTEIISYYPDTSKSIKYGLSNIVAMAEDKNKNFWIAGQTSDGRPTLTYFDTKSKKISKISTDGKRKSLNERLIKDMLIESSGLVIMSTYNNGFYIYDPRDSTVEYHQIGDDPD